MDSTNDDLRVYEFNDGVWAQVGNDLNVATVGTNISPLNINDFAFGCFIILGLITACLLIFIPPWSPLNGIVLNEFVSTNDIDYIPLLLTYPDIDPGANSNYLVDLACKKCSTKALKILLADPRVNPADLGNRAIKSAIQNECVDIVEALLKDGRSNPSDAKCIHKVQYRPTACDKINSLIKDFQSAKSNATAIIKSPTASHAAKQSALRNIKFSKIKLVYSPTGQAQIHAIVDV